MLYALYAHRRLVPLVQIKCLLPSLRCRPCRGPRWLILQRTLSSLLVMLFVSTEGLTFRCEVRMPAEVCS